jgi:REP element-mobilizing transposase RayT
MSPIKTTKPAVYDLKDQFVWIPNERKKLLTGAGAVLVKPGFKRIASDDGWELEARAIQPDQGQVFLQAPPKDAPARMVQVMNRIAAREVFRQFPR